MKVQGYKAGQPIDLEVVYIGGGHYLAEPAARAFLDMAQTAANEGICFHVNTAFRTMEQQEHLYAMYQAGTGALAALPGHSNHQNGIAVDINRAGHPETDAWLKQNAGEFGFKRTVPSEAWHWEYTA